MRSRVTSMATRRTVNTIRRVSVIRFPGKSKSRPCGRLREKKIDQS
jgi:hypothetical protein